METMECRMNKAGIIKKMCIDKRSYALEGANTVVDRFAKEGTVVYYYKCPFCQRYHISQHERSRYYLKIIGGHSEGK